MTPPTRTPFVFRVLAESWARLTGLLGFVVSLSGCGESQRVTIGITLGAKESDGARFAYEEAVSAGLRVRIDTMFVPEADSWAAPAIQAAERARELLVMAVAEKLSVPIENLSLAERRVFDVENPEVGVSFAEAVVLAESKFGTIGTVGSYSPPRSPGRYKGAGVGPSPAYSYSAAVAEA